MFTLAVIILSLFVGAATLVGILIGLLAYKTWKAFGFGWWFASPILIEVAVVFCVYFMLDTFHILS